MGVAVGVGVVVRDDEGRRLLPGRREKAGEPVTSLPGGTLEAGAETGYAVSTREGAAR